MPKILILDDDLTFVRLTKTLLELEGYDVLHDTQERAMIHTVRSEKPDVILLDVFLEETDGMDLLVQLRAEEDIADTRVIMTSGMDLSEQAATAGADAFILKPYEPGQLISTIHRIADTSSSGPGSSQEQKHSVKT